MRRFVPNGPELPYELLQAHEEQRLVFFCGAGISYYTGLPDFEKLVCQIFNDVNMPIPEKENAKTDIHRAFHEKRFDQALHLLERRASDPSIMRKRAIDILSKPPTPNGKRLQIHKALLDLAAVHSDGYRIVTTNFDDRFSRARSGVLAVEAPRVGLPNSDSWRHLTYLHGKINKADPSGEDLILTSRDFGRAYMTDGWASDFVSELFQNFMVLFVGYSLSDPILQYIVDARRGAKHPLYAFAGYKDGEHESEFKAWKMKSVEPILFPTGPEGGSFSLQEDTLEQWARSHRGGLKARISEARKIARNSYNEAEDADKLKNLVWALSKPDGSVAKAFAESPTPPHISWLEPLSKHRLPVGPKAEGSSLFELPLPSGEASAPLAGHAATHGASLPMNIIPYELGKWLARHMNKQELVNWTTKHGGLIHPTWGIFLRDKLENLQEPWRLYWRIVLTGLTIPKTESVNFYFRQSLKNDDWSLSARATLLAATAGWVVPSDSSFFAFGEQPKTPSELSHIADFDLNIAGSYLVRDVLNRCDKKETRNNLAQIADDLTSSLKKLLSLAKEANIHAAEEFSYMRIPSIFDQPNKSTHQEWEVVIRIVRVAFDCLLERDADSARALSVRWREICQKETLILFGRLYLYALTKIEPVLSEEAVNFVLNSDGAVLWNYNARPEVHAFLRMQMKNLAEPAQKKLMSAVESGSNVSAFSARCRIEHIGKIIDSGAEITSALQHLWEQREVKEISKEIKTERHHETKIYEIPASTADDLLGKSSKIIARTLLQERSDIRESTEKSGQRLSDLLAKDLKLGLSVVRILAGKKSKKNFWTYGLLGLQKTKLRKRKIILQTIHDVSRKNPTWLNNPDIQHPLADYLRSIANDLPKYLEPEFMAVFDIIWNSVKYSSKGLTEAPDKAVGLAINSPSGILTEALLYRFLAQNPKKGTGLYKKFWPRIDAMWNGKAAANRLARVIIASHLFWLHKIDSQWAYDKIIKKIENSSEKWHLMGAFLQLACWDAELIRDMEQGLNMCFSSMHEDFDGLRKNFSEFIGLVLVRAPDSLSAETKRAFFEHAIAKQLMTVAWIFGRILKNDEEEDSKHSASKVWREQISPIFENFWPCLDDKLTEDLSSQLLDLSLATEDAFPEAIETLDKIGLLSKASADHALSDLCEDDGKKYDVAQRHPAGLLDLLSRTVDESRSNYHLSELQKVLDRIAAAAPRLKRDSRFKRLSEIAARV